jgi:hypothetical protein
LDGIMGMLSKHHRLMGLQRLVTNESGNTMKPAELKDYKCVASDQRMQRFSPKPSALFSDGFLVPLKYLVVVSGVAAGDPLLSAEDFWVGDSYKLKPSSPNIPVAFEDRVAQELRIFFHDAEVGKTSILTRFTKWITLVSEHGRIALARLLYDPGSRDADTFLLLDERIATSIEHVLIAEPSRID